jgi:tetratricopeptide (TPR) repeat protein
VTRYLRTAFLLIALSLAACASGPTRDQTLNGQGLSAMQVGNMEEAERLLTEAVDENPNNLQALYNLGMLYQKTNRPEKAREYYQRVIDGQADAEKNGMDPKEAEQLAQLARDSIAQMDREEEMRQEAMRQATAKQAAKEGGFIPPAQPKPVPAPVMEESGYRIQTGAYAVAVNAEIMRDVLIERHASLIRGKQVTMVKIDGLTKVRVGPYRTIEEANRACRAFKRAGVSCFRVK